MNNTGTGWSTLTNREPGVLHKININVHSDQVDYKDRLSPSPWLKRSRSAPPPRDLH